MVYISHTWKHHSAFGLWRTLFKSTNSNVTFEVGTDCRHWCVLTCRRAISLHSQPDCKAKKEMNCDTLCLIESPSRAGAAMPPHHTWQTTLHWQTNAAKWKCLEFQLNYHWIDEFGMMVFFFRTFRVRRAGRNYYDEHKQWTSKLKPANRLFSFHLLLDVYAIRIHSSCSISFFFGKNIEFIDETALAVMGTRSTRCAFDFSNVFEILLSEQTVRRTPSTCCTHLKCAKTKEPEPGKREKWRAMHCNTLYLRYVIRFVRNKLMSMLGQKQRRGCAPLGSVDLWICKHSICVTC